MKASTLSQPQIDELPCDVIKRIVHFLPLRDIHSLRLAGVGSTCAETDTAMREIFRLHTLELQGAWRALWPRRLWTSEDVRMLLELEKTGETRSVAVVRRAALAFGAVILADDPPPPALHPYDILGEDEKATLLDIFRCLDTSTSEWGQYATGDRMFGSVFDDMLVRGWPDHRALANLIDKSLSDELHGTDEPTTQSGPASLPTVEELTASFAQSMARKDCPRAPMPSQIARCSKRLSVQSVTSETARVLAREFCNLVHLDLSGDKTVFLMDAGLPPKCDLPDELALCTSLETLDLSNTGMKFLPDCVGKLSCLEELRLSRNAELVSLPEDLGTRMLKLRLLAINGTAIRDLPHSVLAAVERNVPVDHDPELLDLGFVVAVQEFPMEFWQNHLTPARFANLSELFRADPESVILSPDIYDGDENLVVVPTGNAVYLSDDDEDSGMDDEDMDEYDDEIIV